MSSQSYTLEDSQSNTENSETQSSSIQSSVASLETSQSRFSMTPSTGATSASHGFGVPPAPPNENSGLINHFPRNKEAPYVVADISSVPKISISTNNYDYEEFNDDMVRNEKLPPKPSTPLGKVVETGQEHTGRWTREEHEAFLSALQQYGKEWKKVAAKVKTRTVVQTRTHAQKYFQKLQKVMTGDKGDINSLSVEMGTVTEAKKAAPGSVKKKAAISRQKAANGLPPVSTHQRQQAAQAAAATQAAAQLMAQISQVKAPSSHLTSNSTSSFSDNYIPMEQNLPHHYSRPSQTFPSQSEYAQIPSQPPNSSAPTVPDSYSQNTTFASPNVQPTSIKIVPPAPEQTMSKGLFPEPSPAACGKRKVMEIAAAQMLADVAASGAARHPSTDISGKATPPPKNNSEVNVGEIGSLRTKDFRASGPNSEKSPAGPGFGSLQIVNPESLGVSYGNEVAKRRNLGQASPSTPWDGQLAALVSEVKNKEREQKVDLDFNVERRKGGDTEEFEDANSSHPLGKYPYCTRTSLHTAICNGSLQEVKHMIDEAASVMVPGGSPSQAKKLVSLSDSTGFSPLHSAVSLKISGTAGNMAVTMTHLLLSAGAEVDCLDKFGNTPLHWASRVGNGEVVQMLVLKNCPLDLQNEMGETALHWAMRAGRSGMNTVRVLLENGSRSSLFNRKNKRPLDCAADGFTDVDKEMAAARQSFLLSEEERDSSSKTKSIKQAKEESMKVSLEVIEERRQTRANLMCYSPQARTLLLHHPECLEHIPKSETDWEAPARVSSILERILQSEIPEQSVNGNGTAASIRDYEIHVSTEFDRASLELLSRVHSAEYLTFVNDLSKELERRRKKKLIEENGSGAKNNLSPRMTDEPQVVPFTPMVQRTMMRESTVKKGVHSDTSFSAGSLRAARRAAGAVQHAVDCVLVGRNRNAFCVVRPPGHHAGVNGLLSGGESCGFCIFNNVAAGAMYALSDENHRPKCEKCAIVDIDAHHGNGTEEIVRKCHDPGRLLFFSVHLYDHDKRKSKSNSYKFYPGTGDEDDVAHNIINVPIAPLWREKEILQSSNSLPANQLPHIENHHNTRNKAKQKAAVSSASAVKDTGDETASNKGEKASATSSVASDNEPNSNSQRSKSPTPAATRAPPPHYSMGVGREAYRRAIQQRLIPALRAFDPDLILISLGFDASRGDVGNARHYVGGKEAMGIDLEPEDYSWTTRKIMEVADICCQGRVISILEGGYGKTPDQSLTPAADVEERTKLDHLDKTIFSECALRHLQAMIDPYDAEKRFSPAKALPSQRKSQK